MFAGLGADTSPVAPLRTLRNVALAALALGACAAVSPALGAQGNARHRAVCASYHAGSGTLPGSCSKHAGASYGHRVCVNTRLRPSATNTALIRAATLCLINRERMVHGERALRPNKRLRRAAQAHSVSMAFGDYFEHDGPSGQTPLARLRDAGYIFELARRLRSRREHRVGDALSGDAARDRRRLDGLAGTPGEHPRRPLPRNRDRRLAAPARLARPRAARRDLHAGLRRHHRRLTHAARPALSANAARAQRRRGRATRPRPRPAPSRTCWGRPSSRAA